MDSCPEIVRRAIDFAFEALGRQVLYLVCYERNVDDFDNVAEKLEDARKRLQHSIDAARENGEHIEDDVNRWMEKVNEISEDIKNFKEDGNHAKAEFSNCRFPHLWSRHQLSRKAKKMSEAIVEIQGEGTFERISYRIAPKWIGVSSVKTSGSRVSLTNEILESLKDPNIKMVGVFGLGGVGKTTLVKQVASRAEADKLFDVVVIAVVTQKLEVSKIQKELAFLLGLELGEETEGTRAIRLRERFKMERKALIILDDLWEGLDLDRVGIPFGNEHKGCKILLTSRSEEVISNQMDSEKNFYVGFLPEDEALSLFKEFAGLDGSNVEPSILSIAAEVAKKCGGLPIAINTVAKALRKKKISEWRDALGQLTSSTSRNITQVVDSCIELSFRHLESQELKSAFLLCACMDHNISITGLLKYCAGMGLLQGQGIFTIERARDRLETLLAKLKASSLLLEGTSNEHFTMHDVVRSVAISIAIREQNELIVRHDELYEWPEKNRLQNLTAIKLFYSDICELPDVLACPGLKFLHIYSKDISLPVPDYFFKGCCELQVLDFTQMKFSSLPHSIVLLTNLQSLLLDHCFLEDVDLIGELKKLRSLSFRYSDIKKLPQSLQNLSELQLLDLSNCSKLEGIPCKVLSAWKKLEELHMENTFIRWEHEGSTSKSQPTNACVIEVKHLSKLTTLDLHIRDSSIFPRDLQFKDKDLKRYKILIGDVWNWSSRTNSSRTLKIKLNRSDQLEKGIINLLKNVEDLYLDELYGVKNVVYELNEDGFPFLKYIQVQNNSEIRYVVNLKEWFQPFDALPMLELLILNNLPNLEKICHGQLPGASFGKLKVIKVNNCHALRNILSLSMVRHLSQVEEIEVSECNLVEHIFVGEEIEDDSIGFGVLEFHKLRSLTFQYLPMLLGFSSNEKHRLSLGGRKLLSYADDGLSVPLFSEMVALPNLENLKLASINFQKIWQDGPSASFRIWNLTSLTVDRCIYLKYLFSNISVVRSFLNLKYLEISSCHMMEGIFHFECRINNPDSEEVLFPSLETLKLSNMNSLKTLWNQHVTSNAFPKLKTIEIENCQRLVNIIPTYMLARLESLEALTVSNCSSLHEVFSVDAQETYGRMEKTKLKNLCLKQLSCLKSIWSQDTGVFSFQSLQTVEVWQCHSLKHIFPLSIAKNLTGLKEIKIADNCVVEEIVSKDESLKEVAQFSFPEIALIWLNHMPELNWFYPGMYTLKCTKLKELEVMNCDNLELFDMELSGPAKLQEKHQHGHPKIQPLFFIEKVPQFIPTLEILSLDRKDFDKIQDMDKFSMHHFRKLKLLRLQFFYNEQVSFPYWFIQRIPSLEKLVVKFSSFREIFPCASLLAQAKEDRTVYHMKEFTLWRLPKLEYICKEGFQLDPILQKLEKLYVWECSGLAKLLPSNISVNHLTYMEINNCHMLESLSSISTFKSLVQLKTLKIVDCKMMEEIIESDGEEGKGEIEFGILKVFHLSYVPRLKYFCNLNYAFKFPNLEETIVTGCPRFQIFTKKAPSTPKLQRVQVEQNEDEWYWEGNLNATIRRLFDDRVAFRKVWTINLSEFLEFEDIKHQCFQNGMFSNLRYLTVDRCEVWSPIISFNLLCALHNLEGLKVENCQEVEVVFGFDGSKDQTARILAVNPLKKLILQRLPKLKCIWNTDPDGIVSFTNLQEVHVDQCSELKNIFPFSVAKSLLQLEKLFVRGCSQLEDIVARNPDRTDGNVAFLFPQVTSIGIGYMTEVKSFYPGMHTIECPELIDIEVLSCEKLEFLGMEGSNFYKAHNIGKSDMEIHQPMFCIEEVPRLIPKLEKMSLDSKATSIIWDAKISKQVFHNLKFLRIHSFRDKNISFPYWLFHTLSTLEGITVKNCYFEEIFPCTRGSSTNNKGMETISRLKELVLWNLPNLLYICKDGFQLDLTMERLESLYVWECAKLAKLMPSSVSLNNLRYLEINSCDDMVSLMSLATAKSLVLLQTLKIHKCNKIEEIISNDGHTEEKTEFSSLKVLEFLHLPCLESFCSINVEFDIPMLRRVVVKGCPKLSTFAMGVTTTPKLRKVNIDTDNESERFWEGNINSTIQRIYVKKVGHFSLESLELSDFPEVKAIWNDSSQHITFSKLRILVIDDCELMSAIPCHLLRLLSCLEELKVSNCDYVEVIFDLGDTTGGDQPIATVIQLRRLTLSRLRKLKSVWNKDPKGALKFESLQTVCVSGCQNLKNLFPSLLAKGLVQLEELEIESCGLEEIVRIDEGGQEDPVNFIFPRLHHLRIWDLTKLKYFYPGSYTVKWPNLTKLDLWITSEVIVFESKFLSLPVTDTDNGLQPLKKPAFFLVEEAFPILQDLAINCNVSLIKWFSHIPNNFLCRLKTFKLQFFDDEYINFPYWVLQKLPALEKLVVKFSSFEEVFPFVDSAADSEQKKIIYDVKELGLWNLPRLNYLCKESGQQSMLENLQYLCVRECSNLVNLVTSSIFLNNLRYLEIKKCNGLASLITFSTAKSLVQLVELKIEECNKIEEIVLSDGDKEENEIEFRNLKHLELISLPRLKCFWSFDLALSCPKLREVAIKGCPRMTTFIGGVLTAPELLKVQVDHNGNECSCEGDLNATVQELFKTKVALGTLHRLELQECPELKEIWHDQLPDKAFDNLRVLIVENCDFLTTVISINLLCNLKGLEELQVGNSENVEAVFDLQGNDCISDGKIRESESSNLRVFTLNHLPRLKKVWKSNPKYCSIFQKLQVVKLTDCQNLNYLFPCTIAEGLQHLKELEIDSCNEMEEIIAPKEGSAGAVREFIFPNVTSITLTNLSKLKNLHTLEWPRLRNIYTLACDKLAIFTTALNNFQEADLENQRPLFSVEKVIPNLEELSLESRDAKKIWESQFSVDLFGGLKFLRLQYFHDENATFPYWFLEKMHGIKKLVVKYSSFKKIFPCKIPVEREEQCKEGLPRLELISLWGLPRLEYISKEGFQLDPMLENVEHLYLKECPLLTTVAPSSVSFCHLKYLEAWRCHGLVNLMTLTTATSLVQLQGMKVDDCEMLQEIVDINDEEGKREIVLQKLTNLELKNLHCLENFCSKGCAVVLPSLVKVTVTKCPRMKVFSHEIATTPKLQRVKIDDADCWEGDLNSTIKACS